MEGRTGEIMIQMSYQNPYHRDESKWEEGLGGRGLKVEAFGWESRGEVKGIT
jgi:hypothetical protein